MILGRPTAFWKVVNYSPNTSGGRADSIPDILGTVHCTPHVLKPKPHTKVGRQAAKLGVNRGLGLRMVTGDEVVVTGDDVASLMNAAQDGDAAKVLVRIHCIIVMIRWTGLAPWEFEFPFPGSLISTFLLSRDSGRTREKRASPTNATFACGRW